MTGQTEDSQSGPAWLLLVAWAWAILIGLGTSFFPLGRYVVSLWARTAQGVLALSGFMQGLGYLIAGSGC